MNLTEYVWATVQSLTQKLPSEIKVLLDEIEYPRLQRDSSGYVLHLSLPKRVNDNFLSLHGMFFPDDEEGRLSLWRMFRASLFHFCIHSVATNYEDYSQIVDADRPNNSVFSIALVEDYIVQGYMRELWPGLASDTAYANYLTALRFRDLGQIEAEKQRDGIPTKVAANFLSCFMVGKPLVNLGTELDNAMISLHSMLRLYENQIAAELREASGLSRLNVPSSPISNYKPSQGKVELAKQIMSFFKRNSINLPTAYSLAYGDNYGPNFLFDSSTELATPQWTKEAVVGAYRQLGLDEIEDRKTNRPVLLAESKTYLAEWEYEVRAKQLLVEDYQRLDPNTHFEKILFPTEDYAEFERTRFKLAGPISTLLNQLRMVGFSLEDSLRNVSGGVEMRAEPNNSRGEAVSQFVVRSGLKRKEAWAILIDSSKSLETKKKEARDLSACLAEAAHNLINKSSPWACYAFNENLYIVKDFFEPYGKGVKGRIGSLPNGIKTLLPDAVRLVAKRLFETPGDVKVLVVASDGYPAGYEGIDKELVKTIQELKKSGVILIGLGIGSSAIKKYFDLNSVAEEPYDLMKYFVKSYMRLPYLLL